MTYRYPFPYVSGTLFAVVDGTVQPVVEVDPTDPEGGTFDLTADPEDAEVRAYARISPDAVPAPLTPEGEADEEAVPEDVEDDWAEDADLADEDDDDVVEADPDAPEDPDD